MMHLIPIFVKFTKIHNVPINEVYSGHFLKSLAWCMVDVPPQNQNEDIMKPKGTMQNRQSGDTLDNTGHKTQKTKQKYNTQP
jgi:hypothetical protein